MMCVPVPSVTVYDGAGNRKSEGGEGDDGAVKFGRKKDTEEAPEQTQSDDKSARAQAKITEKSQQRAQGIGVQGNALRSAWLQAAAITLITAVAAVAYLVLVREPGQQADILQRVASNYAQARASAVRDAVIDLQTRVTSAAGSAVAMDAVASDSPDAVHAAEQSLESYFPEALSVRILPLDSMGTIYLDGGEELRNNIEVDLVRRAASNDERRPEAYQVDGQWLLSIAAQASHPELEGRSVVLLVTLPQDQLSAWLSGGGPLPGKFSLQQRINSGGGVLDVDTLSVGSGIDQGLEASAVLGTDWKIVFRPGRELVDSVSSTVRGDVDLLLIVSLLALVGGIFALWRSNSALTNELDKILQGADQRRVLDVHVPALAPVARELRKLTLRGSRPDGSSGEATGDEAEPGPITAVKGPASEELPTHIFRAYDIRGVADTELTDSTVFRIASAVGTLADELNEKSIILAHDGRLSSSRIRAVVEKALLDTGRDVINIGLVPTPLMYFATHKLASRSGIMITGSHNAPQFNGMKIVLKGETVAEGTIDRIRQMAEAGAFSTGKGVVEQQDVVSDYLDEIVGDIAMAVPLKIVVDAGNGATGRVAPALLEELGCEVVPLYCDIDGNFPNHGPDTGNDDNLKELVHAVTTSGADFGVAFDGDGDRLAVVTGNGSILRTDRLMMLFARDVVARNPGADVVYDVKCSRILAQLITRLGGRPVLWKTGHALMKQKMVETGALLGGEFSGHVFFGERWYGFDDGMYAMSRLAEIVSSHEGDLDELLSDLPAPISTPEILIPIDESRKFDLIERFVAAARFDGGKTNDLDGLRVDFEDGWGLLRASNTSAALTSRFEAGSEVELQRIMGLFRQQLSAVEPDLDIPF